MSQGLARPEPERLLSADELAPILGMSLDWVYERAKAGEPGLAGYDRWFAGVAGAGPNNASISSVALYTGQVPAFKELLAEEGNDLGRFYARVKVLAALPKKERDGTLAAAARQAVASGR